MYVVRQEGTVVTSSSYASYSPRVWIIGEELVPGRGGACTYIHVKRYHFRRDSECVMICCIQLALNGQMVVFCGNGVIESRKLYNDND